MSRQTQLKPSAVAPQGANDSPVTVFYAVCDPQRSYGAACVDLPYQLFQGVSKDCLNFFFEELHNVYGFPVGAPTDIEFWLPKEPIMLSAAVGTDWADSIGDFKNSFVRVPLHRSFAQTLQGIEDNERLQLVVTFAPPARKNHGDKERDTLSALPSNQSFAAILNTPGPPPSSGAKSREYATAQMDPKLAIHDGRIAPNGSFSTVAPPIEIFHPIFANFRRMVQDPRAPRREDLISVQKLILESSQIRSDWEEKYPVNITQLETILDRTIHRFEDADGMGTVVTNSIYYPSLIVATGGSGTDSPTKASIAMRRAWIHNSHTPIRNKCCCPTFLLAMTGPWLCVLGGVFTDKIIVQRMTDMIWIAQSSTHEDARMDRITRVLIALRTCLDQLDLYYHTLAKDARIPSEVTLYDPHPRFFPFPKYYMDDESGRNVGLKYLRALEDSASCTVYLAEIQSEDSGDSVMDIVVVKFPSAYCPEAHRFLAAQGHAPALRYCDPLLLADDEKAIYGDSQDLEMEVGSAKGTPGMCLGSVKMVVMDFVRTRAAIQAPPPTNAREQLEDVLAKLHGEGYVFGDLRDPNIMFDEDDKVKLIDFDWAGRFDTSILDPGLGETLQATITENASTRRGTVMDHANEEYAHYPLNIARTIDWANGVDDLVPIRPIHDWEMLRALRLLNPSIGMVV